MDLLRCLKSRVDLGLSSHSGCRQILKDISFHREVVQALSSTNLFRFLLLTVENKYSVCPLPWTSSRGMSRCNQLHPSENEWRKGGERYTVIKTACSRQSLSYSSFCQHPLFTSRYWVMLKIQELVHVYKPPVRCQVRGDRLPFSRRLQCCLNRSSFGILILHPISQYSSRIGLVDTSFY